MKLLTVVIPSYNVESYLTETVESILKCAEKDKLDVIVVNDGSKDNTLQIATSYRKRYPNIVQVFDKENGGHGSTINSGLSIAKGKYFIVVDGDDWVDSIIMDEFIDFLEDSESDVIITGHYRNYVKNTLEEKYNYKEEKGLKVNVKYILNQKYLIPMTDICYKTSLLQEINLTIQENTFYVDEEFCSIPFQQVNTIQFFSKGFYHYRIGDINQSISVINVVKHIDHKIRVFTRIMKLTGESALLEDNKEYIRKKMIGIANSIFLVYYIYDQDKKRGRKQGDAFYSTLQKEYPDMVKECEKVRKIFKIMNRLHMNASAWEEYKKLKHVILRRK